MNYQKANVIFLVLGLSGCIAAMIGSAMDSKLMMAGGIAAVAVALFIHWKYYRCPHCGAPLGRGGWKFCHSCGKKLEL